MRKELPYQYVRDAYGVTPEPGARVTMANGTKAGTIARRQSYDNYVYVTFDGTKFSVPCHPLDLSYGTQTDPSKFAK